MGKAVDINYFDLGLYKNAGEIDLFTNLCKQQGITHNIYGFEAHPTYCEALIKKYQDDPNIKIVNNAISDKNGPIKLYLTCPAGGEGNSIFKTKNNVHKDVWVEVDGVLFSDWLNQNVPNLNKSNNILRFNIEGAEWFLMNDLVSTGLIKYFPIILGSQPDIYKVKELEDKIQEYTRLLNDNHISVHRYTDYAPEKNVDLYKLIESNFNIKLT